MIGQGDFRIGAFVNFPAVGQVQPYLCREGPSTWCQGSPGRGSTHTVVLGGPGKSGRLRDT